ncbi:OstA-like protein [Flavobacterium hauense]
MKKLLFLFIAFISLYSPAILAQKQIVIEHVDFSEMNQAEIPGAIVLSGNVVVLHDGIRMTCHKAYHFTKENYIKLFGDVKMNQGDTLFMDSRYAEYNGNKKFAYATGDVLMRSPDMRLTTDTINFDRSIQQAYYNSYGTIVNGENTLKSKSGRYIAGQKKYEFRTAVTLTNPKHVLKSNHLDYYTNSGHSYVFGPSTITSKEDFIYTEKGFYDTKKNQAELLTNSYIKHDTQVIRGDKLYYDKQRNYSSGTNNVRVKDTVNKYILEGHYAEIYRKPLGDSLVMTKHAVAKTLVEKDTLYTHAKFMVVTGKPGERVVRGYNNARFYKVDMSGKCDSIHSDEKKGLTQMIKNPVVWNGDSQLTGDRIHLISNSKTEQLDSLKVLGNAFIIQKDTIGTGYNQVKGKNLYGKFRDNKLYEVDLIGNAEKIVYMYDKLELFGIDKGKGSRIHLDIVDNKITTFVLYQKTESETYPDSEFPESVRKFRGFVWRGDEMILTKDDIFPQEEKDLHDKIVNKSTSDKKVEDTPMEPLKKTLEYDKNNPQPKPKPEAPIEQKK